MTVVPNPNQKQVRFGEATNLEVQAPQQQPLMSLWYTREEQHEQLADAKRVIPAWRRPIVMNSNNTHHHYDYAILLEDSYQNPHSKVQEYLYAFCAQEFTLDHSKDNSSTMRGLELSLGTQHAMERHEAKQKHRRAVLTNQAILNDDELAHCSRVHSSSSKLFAMRMGRADARVAAASGTAATTTTQMADSICQEHLQREQWQQQWKLSREQHQQQLERISASIHNVVNHPPNDNNNNTTVALSYPNQILWRNLPNHCNNNNNHQKMSLSSLICLRAPHDNLKPSSSSSSNISPRKYHAHVIMALPIQHVVYGRYSVVTSSGYY